MTDLKLVSNLILMRAKVFCARIDMIKYLILIISVSRLIASVGGLAAPASVEVNETIVNYRSLSSKTMESNKERALEQRLADVL